MNIYTIKVKQSKVNDIFIELGAEKITLICGECYTYNGVYFRTDIIPFSKEPFIVIEVADNLEQAQKNIFEDADSFPLISLTENQLLAEVRSTLLNKKYNYGF